MANRFSVTRNGIALDRRLYTWNEETKTFSTNEEELVLDFREWGGVTFRTRNNCIFHTGNNCNFITGENCTFTTGNYCFFHTGGNCTFQAGCSCTFITCDNCVFNTGSVCVFQITSHCVLNVGGDCTFITADDCTFNNIGARCALVRRDAFETHVLPNRASIKLNKWTVPGYEIVPKAETKEELLAKIVQKLKTCDVEKLKKFLELEN